jgi:hypothetical protein
MFSELLSDTLVLDFDSLLLGIMKAAVRWMFRMHIQTERESKLDKSIILQDLVPFMQSSECSVNFSISDQETDFERFR